MNILAFDTASQAGSVAILKDDHIIAHTQLNIGLTHSEKLLPSIHHIVNISDFDIKSLDAIAITRGPGSFTGLRIGYSTGKGFAIGLKKPLIPVPTLDVLAANGAGFSGIIVPIMNARRGQVYTAIYQSDGHKIEKITPYQAIALDALLNEIVAKMPDVKVYFTGDGLDSFEEIIIADGRIDSVFAQGCRRNVCADVLAFIAKEYLDNGWEDTHEAPIYLRESEAVIQWREKHPGESLED